jgi:hypothetical protein
MGCMARVNEYQEWIVHCDILTTESGKQIPMFWADKTFRNFFERSAWKSGGQL